MQNNYFFAAILVILAVVCFLAGSTFLIICGIILAGIALYSLKQSDTDKAPKRVSVYTHSSANDDTAGSDQSTQPAEKVSTGVKVSVSDGKYETVDEISGEKTTYNSLSEMPPDIRNRFENSAKRMKETIKSDTADKSFSYTGNDGIEKTYKSLEEMPPEVRKIIEESVDLKRGDDHS